MPPPSRKLNTVEVRILTFVEQKFWETGGLPTNDKIVEELNVTKSKAEACWKNPVFRQALIARGIDFKPESSNSLLTPLQMVCVNMFLNVYDRRSLREKLGELGITTQQFNAWKREPNFAAYVRNRAEQLFKGSDDEFYLSLLKQVQQGDMSALRMFGEMRGLYNPKVDVNIDIDGMLAKIIEIVSRHVTPDILKAIADDMERNVAGMGTPTEPKAIMEANVIDVPEVVESPPALPEPEEESDNRSLLERLSF